MDGIPIKKLYYSIGEVSQLTGLEPYVLRYWETEYPDLRPRKNRAGNRMYTLEDIRLVFLIKKLLYIDKYTIDGARQRLRWIREGKEGDDPSLEDLQKIDWIWEVRKGLEEILETLGQDGRS